MAEIDFYTDFTKLEKTAMASDDKIMVQEQQYVEAKELVDKWTGLDTVSTGVIPKKKRDGTLGDTDLQEAAVLRIDEAETYNNLEIPICNLQNEVRPSGFYLRTIRSWLSTAISGLFKANFAANGSTLVGRIGVANSTGVGVSLGLYNNGVDQKVAIHATAGSEVSSTPQWVATEKYVSDLTTIRLYATTTDDTSVEFLDALGNRLPEQTNPYQIQFNAHRTGDDLGVTTFGEISSISPLHRGADHRNNLYTTVPMVVSDGESEGIWFDFATQKLYAKGQLGFSLDWVIDVTYITTR